MAIYYSCLISDCGQLLLIVPQLSGTAPAGGFDQLLPVTAVAGTPVLKKNGTSISIGPVVWDEGHASYGGPGTAIGFLLTGGAVLSSDVMTCDIPANFVNGSSPAYTAVAVMNGTGGGLEHPFGAGNVSGATGCPGLNVTPTARLGVDTGGGGIDPTTPNYLLWNQAYRGNGVQYAPGSSGPATIDEHRNLLTWTPGTIRIICSRISESVSGINAKGAPNQPGKWTFVIDDFGTLPSTFSVQEVSGNGTATLVSNTASGTTHTLVCDIQYASSNPSAWTLEIWLYITSPANNTGGSDGLSHWAYGTPGTSDYIFASPPALDGSAMTVDRSNPFAINPNVRAQLTSGGHTVEHIRQMTIFGGAGLNNRIYACDLPSIEGTWVYPRAIGPITFNHVRFLNTNPAKGSAGDNTYAWPASTRVYGPQADFVFNDGGTTALTATLTAGNRAFTVTSGTMLLAGGLITGTGIPADTRLANFTGSSGWLERPATASGSQSITLHNPGYLSIAPTDNGAFLVAGFGAEHIGVYELRSDVPHGMTTGYYPGGDVPNDNHHNAIVFDEWGSFDPTGVFCPLMVTGPYTIAVSCFIDSGLTDPGPRRIVPTTEYDFTSTGGYQLGVQIPQTLPYTFPYEAHVAMTVDLGCHACYLTFPIWGTDSLYEAIGKIAFAYGPSIIHRIEVADEPWDGFGIFSINILGRLARQNLYGQQTAGTVISEYFTADGFGLPFGEFAMAQNVLLTGHAGNVFKAAFVAAGGDGSKVELIAGSQYNASSTTQDNAGAAQLWGVPIRWVVVAPYINTPFSTTADTSIQTAFSTAGGAWPLGAINDFARLYHAYNYYEQLFLALHFGIFQTWGEPIEPCTVVDAGNHGGSFAPSGAGFRFWYTYLDSHGNETTVGQSDSGSFNIASGNSPGFTMPRTLSWVVSINLYLGSSSWVSPQSFFYTNLTVAGNPVGSQIIFTAAYNTGNPHPPTVSQVTDPAVIGTPPQLAGYEGGQVQPVPTFRALTAPYLGNPEWMALTHDVMAHPSVKLDIPTMMAATQNGCQWVPGSGLKFYTHFQSWNYPGPNSLGTNDLNEYLIYAGIGQVPGPGLSNKYAIRGAPGDGVDHNGGAPLSSGFNGVAVANQSPRGQGLLNWVGGSSPTPTPTATPARRALPGLRTIP